MSPSYYVSSSRSLLQSLEGTPEGRQAEYDIFSRANEGSFSSAGFSLTLTFGSNWWTVCLRPPLHSGQVSRPEISAHSHGCTNKYHSQALRRVCWNKRNFSQGISTAKGCLRNRFLKYTPSVLTVSLKNLLSVEETADAF